MTSFVATINVPGYLPMDDEPPVFDTAQEAWSYLAEERTRAEDQYPEWCDHSTCQIRPCDEYSETRETLSVLAEAAHWEHSERDTWLLENRLAPDGTGAVYGSTPGYDGDHDLGLAYNVDAIECEYSRAPITGTLNCSIHGAYPECAETED
ncbi:MAG TPA: hypothetical protein VHK27_05000 [Gammaproteobacteria bacterium]|nr:hypothetical protein [Gammaproteobacteria bacterium]